MTSGQALYGRRVRRLASPCAPRKPESAAGCAGDQWWSPSSPDRRASTKKWRTSAADADV